jgi:hypothetical protein
VVLCERAEAIQDAIDWQKAANEMKRLQSEWREIGAVPRKKSDEVWKRFRTACDRFFDRYKRRDEVELEERLKTRQSLIDELIALGPSKRETQDGLAERVQGIWNAWKSAGPLPEAALIAATGEPFARCPRVLHRDRARPRGEREETGKDRRAPGIDRRRARRSKAGGGAPGKSRAALEGCPRQQHHRGRQTA